jgi:photosystem II stability/assembly factor-like uncharacterized protein
MMSATRRRLLLLAPLPLALFLAGCFHTGLLGGSKKQAPPPPPVGVYRSGDRGDTWGTKNAVLSASASARPTLNATNVQVLLMDPTDPRTIYLGSQGSGLYYTYDRAESWWQSRPIPAGTINAVAVPAEATLRCTVYVATTNQIFKSTDCGRYWEQVYVDTRRREHVLSLAVHLKKPQTVYAGLTTGDLVKSDDGGKRWETIARLPGKITRLIPHTLNPETFYLTVEKRGVSKSTDGGKTWQELNEALKTYKGSLEVRDIVIDPTRPETIIVATPYGLVRTTDGGVTWAPLRLITPPGKANISALTLNPAKPAELYYTTDTTLFRSSDAGETWETRTLPVQGAKTKLLVDPQDGKVLYLGVLRAAPKKDAL